MLDGPEAQPGPGPGPGPGLEPGPAAPGGPSPWLVLLRCLAAGVTTALAVLLLWPASLGGRSVLVVVHGTSMAPLFQPGDLLYGQVADRYEVGEIAIFRVPDDGPTAGQLVVHRVVGIDDSGRYIMEGDNRPDEDGLRPGPDDMVARPLLDLGPWPVRVFRTLPWILGGLVASALGRLLWPAEPAPAPTASGMSAPAVEPPGPRVASEVTAATVVVPAGGAVADPVDREPVHVV